MCPVRARSPGGNERFTAILPLQGRDFRFVCTPRVALRDPGLRLFLPRWGREIVWGRGQLEYLFSFERVVSTRFKVHF